MYLCVFLSIHPSIYLFAHLSIHPSFYLSLHTFIYLSIYPPFYLIYLSIHTYKYLSIHPSIYLSIHTSIQLSIYLPELLALSLPAATAKQTPTQRKTDAPIDIDCKYNSARDGLHMTWSVVTAHHKIHHQQKS